MNPSQQSKHALLFSLHLRLSDSISRLEGLVEQVENGEPDKNLEKEQKEPPPPMPSLAMFLSMPDSIEVMRERVERATSKLTEMLF